MKLAVPIFLNDGNLVVNCNIIKPRTEVITAAYEAMQNGNIFKAMIELIFGGISDMTDKQGQVINQPGCIRESVQLMPYVTGEDVSTKIMCLLNKNEFVEGVYECPRCRRKVITEYDEFTGSDTRDKISDLKTVYLPDDKLQNEIPVNLSIPIKLMNEKTEEVLETVNSFAIRYPTLSDCAVAAQGMQEGHEVRVQLKIYLNALTKINGNSINRSFIDSWGPLIFRKTDPGDLEQIGNVLQTYGLNKMVKKSCPNCGKEWQTALNTSNFFASGLRPL